MPEEKACEFWDVICQGKSGATDALTAVADEAITNLARSILEGLSQMVTALSTFWVSMPTVNLTTTGGSRPSVPVGFLESGLAPWTLALAVLSVIIGGTRMIWEQRGAPLKDLLRSLLTLTLVSGIGLAVISILVVAADAFAAAIIDTSTDGKGFAQALALLTLTNSQGAGVFILIILGLVGLLTSLAQIVLMIIRSGMLVILAGILPTTAAFTNTEMGRQWFQKAVGWTIAFILYKPAAAIVYAVAFKLMDSGTGKNTLLGSITGFALMIVALLALPALMRFVIPMVGVLAAGAGGGAVAGAALGAVATGAVSLGRGGSGRGSAFPIPASPGSGPGGAGRGSTGAGSTGPGGRNGARGRPAPGGAASGAASSGTAATAGAGAAAGAGKVPGPGPAGMVVAAGAQAVSRFSRAAQQAVQDSTRQSGTPEGPSGSS